MATVGSAGFRTWALTLGALLLLSGCGAAPPDEERIRQRIQDMTQGLADRDTRAVMAPLADDFVGETWNLDERAVRLILQREMRAHERLRAHVQDLSIELHGAGRASAEFRVVLTGGSGLIPARGRLMQVRTGWRLDADEWMLISASWDDVIGF